jgi:hypothetical protein
MSNTKISQENDLVRTPSIVGRWTNFADRRDLVAIEAKLGDDYESNDQGVKVADVPVINAYRSPADRTPPNRFRDLSRLYSGVQPARLANREMSPCTSIPGNASARKIDQCDMREGLREIADLGRRSYLIAALRRAISSFRYASRLRTPLMH